MSRWKELFTLLTAIIIVQVFPLTKNDVIEHIKSQQAVMELGVNVDNYPDAMERAYDCFSIKLNGYYPTRTRYFSALKEAVNSLVESITSLIHSTEKVEEVAISAPPALLIGINYYGTGSALANCIYDTEHIMDRLLESQLGYTNKQITLMTDDAKGTNRYPTGRNIVDHMIRFCSDVNKAGEGYMHYSGHGSWIYDKNGDEADRKDEVLVPVDYDTGGYLVDDDIYKLLRDYLSPDVKVTMTMDCCHSGTVLDLPYRWLPTESNDVVQHEKTIDPNLPNIVMLSGCHDTQTSADGGTVEGDGKGAGAMTAAYLKTLADYNYTLTYRQLLDGVRQNLRKGGFTQIPQLSSTKNINLDDFYLCGKVVLRP
jgi:metacaspase-1